MEQDSLFHQDWKAAPLPHTRDQSPFARGASQWWQNWFRQNITRAVSHTTPTATLGQAGRQIGRRKLRQL
ncbi:MAG: hypothetical protein CMJ75_10700 [Planctomycetaceae bacterium]|nr:hypothetical protein [Planctomycetaceae bacterium]